MIGNKPSIYNAQSVYNQGGGGWSGESISPGVSLDGFKKLQFISINGNYVHTQIPLYTNNERNFKFSDKAFCEFYLPTLTADSHYASINLFSLNRVGYNRGLMISKSYTNKLTFKIFSPNNDYDIKYNDLTSFGNFGNSVYWRKDNGQFCQSVNDRIIYGETQPVTTDYDVNYTLFMYGGDNINYFAGTKIFSFSVYDQFGEKLKLNVIPVKRILDSVLGFFDLVSGVFYPAFDSTALTAGPEVQ